MKWERETSDERSKRLHDWHEWFAWRPIRLHRINEQKKELVETREIIWCETVMRKYTSHGSRIYATSEDAVVQKLSEINDPAGHNVGPIITVKRMLEEMDD